MACDAVIQTGTVVDGTRRPSSRADVAGQGGRITAVCAVSGPAKRTYFLPRTDYCVYTAEGGHNE